MPSNPKKIKYIYLPFLAMTLCFVAGYTLVYWALFVNLGVFPVQDDIVEYALPYALSWIPILLLLRSRIKLLDFTGRSDYTPFIYQIVASLAMAIPTILAVNYTETATGTLTALDTITQIEKHEPTKYYKLNEHYLDNTNIGIHIASDISGKLNEYYNMHIYIAVPLLAREQDTVNSRCSAFVGFEFSHRISNDLNDNEKDQQFKLFAGESERDFFIKVRNNFVYLDNIRNSTKADGFKEASTKCVKYTSTNPLFLLPVNEPFEARNGDTLQWMLGTLGFACALWLVMVFAFEFKTAELQEFEAGNTSAYKDIQEFLTYLIPQDGYFITPILLYINLLLYAAMVLSGLGVMSFNGQNLLSWGANYSPLTTHGEWWRLLTSTFIHSGLLHVVANMYGLLIIGMILEPLLGKIKFLGIYLFIGIIASCASLWWYDATISVGASGAIFGLYGIFLVLALRKAFPPELDKKFASSIVFYIGYSLFMGFRGGIDNAAHIGGLLSGVCVGALLYQTLQAKIKAGYNSEKNA
ncbi:MAG: rhomboid family intramembrane serine protease [Ignavibacteria bacterium]|nr:rhomboid family intramembrane serine protease [Ignavibacteria bacterium]